MPEMINASDAALRDAVNLICKYAGPRLPDGYKVVLTISKKNAAWSCWTGVGWQCISTAA